MNTNETKACQYCAEEILAAAIKCKHCGSDLSTHEQTGQDHDQIRSLATEPILPDVAFVRVSSGVPAHSKIPAIKSVREATRFSLSDAKACVDRCADEDVTLIDCASPAAGERLAHALQDLGVSAEFCSSVETEDSAVSEVMCSIVGCRELMSPDTAKETGGTCNGCVRKSAHSDESFTKAQLVGGLLALTLFVGGPVYMCVSWYKAGVFSDPSGTLGYVASFFSNNEAAAQEQPPNPKLASSRSRHELKLLEIEAALGELAAHSVNSLRDTLGGELCHYKMDSDEYRDTNGYIRDRVIRKWHVRLSDGWLLRFKAGPGSAQAWDRNKWHEARVLELGELLAPDEYDIKKGVMGIEVRRR